VIQTHRYERTKRTVPVGRAQLKNAGRDGFYVESAMLPQINIPAGFVPTTSCLRRLREGGTEALIVSTGDRFGPDSISVRRSAVGDGCMKMGYRVFDEVQAAQLIHPSVPRRTLLVVRPVVARSGDGHSIIGHTLLSGLVTAGFVRSRAGLWL